MDNEDRTRSEAYIIVLLVTILLLVGFGTAQMPVFSSSPATGFAVLGASAPEEEAAASAQNPDIGSSRSPASFSLGLLYDFSDYTVIRQQVLGREKEKGLVDLIRECTGDSDECSAAAVLEINKREDMKSAGLTMIDGPCDQRENIWSDAVEGIGACLALAKDGCACPVTLSRSAQVQDNSDDGADDPITIIAEKEDGSTAISLDDRTLPLRFSLDSEISGYTIT